MLITIVWPLIVLSALRGQSEPSSQLAHCPRCIFLLLLVFKSTERILYFNLFPNWGSISAAWYKEEAEKSFNICVGIYVASTPKP
ncbi:hypothetical protein [Candidatus Paracaedibacter symbiosus]|uniref:hypothetical protein n=1 Tax=Candidatus Paracaedibacter symbiosus TaxID=244582 RepID=UPI0005095E90|nr:hypothetical protein [Candidatus Paracaedibacter symbiosus]